MKGLSASDLLDLSIDILWEKDGIRHIEKYFAGRLNCWRDAFPGTAVETIFKKSRNFRKTVIDFAPGEIIPDYDSSKLTAVPWSRVSGKDRKRFKAGRFYPQGLLSGNSGVKSSQNHRLKISRHYQ